MASFVGCCLDSCPDNNKQTANEYADAASVAIGEEAADRERRDLPKIVDDEDDTRGGASACQAKGVLVAFHGVDGTHE